MYVHYHFFACNCLCLNFDSFLLGCAEVHVSSVRSEISPGSEVHDAVWCGALSCTVLLTALLGWSGVLSCTVLLTALLGWCGALSCTVLLTALLGWCGALSCTVLLTALLGWCGALSCTVLLTALLGWCGALSCTLYNVWCEEICKWGKANVKQNIICSL